jgi:DNA-binding protein HU-beta
MNKSQFIDEVAETANLGKGEAQRAVDAMVEVIKRALAQGEVVSLVGFGSFEVRSRAARTGRNPKTGEELKIAASKAPAFKAGKALKDAVN